MSVAPWPLIDDIKTALKLPMTDLSQDGEIQGWIAACESLIQMWTGETVASSAYTDVDRTVDLQPVASFAPPRSLFLKHMPVDLTKIVTVVAYDGSQVDTIGPNPTGPPYYSTTQMFYVDPLFGLIYGVMPGDVTFGNGPYAITYNAGLVCHPKWVPMYRAIAAQIVRDFCRWFQEIPVGVKSMSAGGGVSESFDLSALPPRMKMMLNLLPNGSAKLGLA
jgi:hypothetical protein